MTTPQLPPSKDFWNRGYRLGRVLGLTLTFETSAILSFVLLWIVLAVIGSRLLNLTGPDVFVGGLILALLHYIMEFLHQFGHALAAATTGHGMTGIHFYYVLGRSIYPPKEPRLSADIHIRRALGGPIISITLAFLFSFLAILLIPVGGLVWYMVIFLMLDNLLVFGLGALLPLSFTDGGTLMRYWSERTPRK